MIFIKKIVPAFMAMVFAATGCVTPLPKKQPESGKTYSRTLDIRAGGFRRNYLVHIPLKYRPDTPIPLVIIIHGAFSTAEEIETQSEFSRLADKENFITVYPNGMGIFGWLQHWNAGHCCGKAADDELDDIGFLEMVIQDAGSRLNVDQNRIYMAGLSNGGMLTHRFAAEKSETIAAAAVLVGAIGSRDPKAKRQWKMPTPEAPVPMLIIHGTSDDIIPYDGGAKPARGGTRSYKSVADAVNYWSHHNNCIKEPVRKQLHDGKVKIARWYDNKDRVMVERCTLIDWPHRWPGKFFMKELPDNDGLKSFDGTRHVWEFFKTRRRSE